MLVSRMLYRTGQSLNVHRTESVSTSSERKLEAERRQLPLGSYLLIP